MSYKELRDIYSEHFSLGYINDSIETKFALISLICYVTQQARKKNRSVTYYQVIKAITKDISFPDSFIVGLSIICEEFGYGCNKFPLFGLKGKQIISQIKEILEHYVPF